MNMHADIVAHAANELDDMMSELVLVGGCATGLLVTDPTAVRLRSTKDVDVVTSVTTRRDYYRLDRKMLQLGFQNVKDLTCRYKKGFLILDLIPLNEEILGFSNPWYPEGIELSRVIQVAPNVDVKLIHPILFVASKLEAFNNRGGGDFMTSQDMEDIVTVVNGRIELTEEIYEVSDEARSYVSHEIETLLGEAAFINDLPALLEPDSVSQARLPIIIERLTNLAQL